MRQIITLAFVLLGIGVEAQTLVDTKLNQYVRQTLVDGIKVYGDDVNEAGVVVMEVNSGNVIANVAIGKSRGVVRDISQGNSEPVPQGIGRAALYLSMMGTLKPGFIVETGNGLYTDSITGCTIVDTNHRYGGYDTLTLKNAFDVSDVGIIKAMEVAFDKNMERYDAAIRKTGILFGDVDAADSYQDSVSWKEWSPCDIMGYSSPYSLLKQTAWINMIANGGNLLLRQNENDSVTPICTVKNKSGLDSLASAMFEAVQNGTGKKMKSQYFRVAGIVNVSPPDALNCRACFAAAFWPYESPQYTIGIYVNKHDKPDSRIIASKIANQIIEQMSEKYLHLKNK